MQQAFSSLHHQLLLEVRSQAYERQLAQLREQVAQIDDLKAGMVELREHLGQNSSNSSKPPSSDLPRQPQQVQRQPSGRKPGGQPDHPRSGRKLKAVAQVDRVIDLRPVSCSHCGGLLLGDDPRPARHQVSEIPPTQPVVTEYRRHTLRCLSCGVANQAPWPNDMPTGSFGPRAQAVVAYLSGCLHASHRDVVKAMDVLHGLNLSLGSVPALQQQVSYALAAPVQTAQGYAQRQAVNHVDETSWRQHDKLHWLRLLATHAVTVFRVRSGRGAAQAKQVISKTAKAIVITDRYNAYNWLPQRRRQLCWAHLKRAFQAMADGLCGKSSKLAKTECCNQWICSDVDEYVLFSYAHNSCWRNHQWYTLCGYHFAEEHEGDWRECAACEGGFETEMYVWYGTNEYNFVKLKNPPKYEPTRCAKCKWMIRLAEDGYSMKAGGYYCMRCSGLDLTRL